MRIQFYPQNEKLERELLQEAKAKGVTVSELLNSILNERYGIFQGGLSKPEIYEIVEKEIQEFIANEDNHNIEFSLNQASKTFSNLEQHFQKPTAIRAVIGRRFAAMAGKQEPYLAVQPVMMSNGKQKCHYASRAALYIVTTKEEN